MEIDVRSDIFFSTVPRGSFLFRLQNSFSTRCLVVLSNCYGLYLELNFDVLKPKQFITGCSMLS